MRCCGRRRSAWRAPMATASSRSPVARTCLPVRASRRAACRSRSMRFAEVDAIVDRHLGTRYTAIVVRIERGGRAVYERAAGTLRSDGGGSAYVDTRFDVASITKVFVSTVALALVAGGVLKLDEPLAGASTLRMILAHTGG